jgi:hypothetical protein
MAVSLGSQPLCASRRPIAANARQKCQHDSYFYFMVCFTCKGDVYV